MRLNAFFLTLGPAEDGRGLFIVVIMWLAFPLLCEKREKKKKKMWSVFWRKKKRWSPCIWAYGGSAVKSPPAVQETQVRSRDWEHSLQNEMATHFRNLAWRIPGTDEPGGRQSR